MAFEPGDIPMSFQNVEFSSAKVRALTGLYTDMYEDGGDDDDDDDDAVLRCFLFYFSV